jgi:hypothetical protein
MPGIYERVKQDAQDRIAVHLLRAMLHAKVKGVLSGNQIREKLDETITVPLTAAEITDLSGIVAKMDSLVLPVEKLEYLLWFESIGMMVETGAITSEATMRTQLGI